MRMIFNFLKILKKAKNINIFYFFILSTIFYTSFLIFYLAYDIVQSPDFEKYIVYLDRFVIQDLINNQEEVIVQRFPKENFFNSIYECNEEMKKISNELLDIKYSYLFEYKEIENYEQDYISIIEPNEQKYELLEKKKEDLKKKQNAPLLDKERKLQEVQLEYKRIQEELKSYEPGEINPKKKIVLKDYIETQKKLLNLKMKHELLIEYDIKETTTINKELPKLDVEELPPLVYNGGVEEQKN